MTRAAKALDKLLGSKKTKVKASPPRRRGGYLRVLKPIDFDAMAAAVKAALAKGDVKKAMKILDKVSAADTSKAPPSILEALAQVTKATEGILETTEVQTSPVLSALDQVVELQAKLLDDTKPVADSPVLSALAQVTDATQGLLAAKKAPFADLKAGLEDFLKEHDSVAVTELAFSFDASPQQITKYLESQVKAGKLAKEKKGKTHEYKLAASRGMYVVYLQGHGSKGSNTYEELGRVAGPDGRRAAKQAIKLVTDPSVDAGPPKIQVKQASEDGIDYEYVWVNWPQEPYTSNLVIVPDWKAEKSFRRFEGQIRTPMAAKVRAAKDTGSSKKDKDRSSKVQALVATADALKEAVDLGAFPEAKAACDAVAALKDMNTKLTEAQIKLKAAPAKTEEADMAQATIDELRDSLDTMLPPLEATMKTMETLLMAAAALEEQFAMMSEEVKGLEEKLKTDKERLAAISKAVEQSAKIG